MSTPSTDTKPKDWRKMFVKGPPISPLELHRKLVEARPGPTPLHRKRDKLMARILRQQEALLAKLK